MTVQNTALKEISVAAIYDYGYEVFGDVERFNSWMFRPNKALAGARPADLLNNPIGGEQVHNLIGRIDHGVYS